MTTGGLPTHPQGFQIGESVSTGIQDQRAPAVAIGGNSFLVGWFDSRNDLGAGTNSDIYGQMVME